MTITLTLDQPSILSDDGAFLHPICRVPGKTSIELRYLFEAAADDETATLEQIRGWLARHDIARLEITYEDGFVLDGQIDDIPPGVHGIIEHVGAYSSLRSTVVVSRDLWPENNYINPRVTRIVGIPRS